MQAVTEFLVWKGREEAEGGIGRPGETQMILARVATALEDGFAAERPFDGIPRSRRAFASASAEAATLAARS